MKEDIDQFLTYLERERDGSSNTIDAYRNDLYAVYNFLEENGLSQWGQVEPKVLSEFFGRGIIRHGYRDASIARKTSSVKSFFRFLIDQGTVSLNPATELMAPRISRQKPQYLTRKEVQRLLKVIPSDSPKGKRDRAMVELPYGSGITVTELVNLDVGDADYQNGLVSIRTGRAQRHVPITHPAEVALEDYVTNGRPYFMRDPNEQALFLNHRADRLTRQWVWYILREYATKAGIRKRITPYTLRHSFAVHTLDKGGSMEDVQISLGHTTIITTRIYASRR